MRWILAILLLAQAVRAADITAASASLTHVQAAVDAASSGDTILIPDSGGEVTWSSPLNTSTKQLIIRAQNYTPTSRPTASTTRNVIIKYSGTTAHAFNMVTGNTFHCGVGGIKFVPPVVDEQGGAEDGIWGYVHFTGSGSKPPLLFDCWFVGNDRENVSAEEAAFLSLDSLGGVVWNCYFDGTNVPEGTSVANMGMGGAGIHTSSPRAWATASTMGTLDTDGLVNHYFEDCRWKIWGQSDVDDDGRLVVRQSTIDGTGWQTHGFTSAVGGRHCEIYDCDLINTVEGRNHRRYFWLRAGTVLIADCLTDDNDTGFGGLTLLSIGDNTSPGGAYPVNRGPGRGHNGSSHVADPIYIFGNTGGEASSWAVNDSSWDSHVVLDRDIFVDAGSKPSTDGSPGAWAKFEYPHPLREQIEDGESPTPGTATATTVNATTVTIGN